MSAHALLSEELLKSHSDNVQWTGCCACSPLPSAIWLECSACKHLLVYVCSTHGTSRMEQVIPHGGLAINALRPKRSFRNGRWICQKKVSREELVASKYPFTAQQQRRTLQRVANATHHNTRSRAGDTQSIIWWQPSMSIRCCT